MAVLQTTTCRRHGHAEFRITYDPLVVPVEADVRWFVDWLEESVAAGQKFIPGQTCQVGWAITEIRACANGSLSLWEPDMRAIPFVRVESVSTTLSHLRLQKDVVESVLLPADLSFPSMRESCLICNRFGKADGLVMERAEPSGSDSGWFCGCYGTDHDHNNPDELRRVSLYEAAVRYDMQIVPYLALPVGVLLAIEDNLPTPFRDGEPLTFKPGSLLAARESKG